MSEWISVKDALPPREESVWCRRYFVRGDGSEFSEVTEARRDSDSPLTLNEDASRDDFWKGDGNNSGRSWSDSTVSHWMKKTPPEPPKD